MESDWQPHLNFPLIINNGFNGVINKLTTLSTSFWWSQPNINRFCLNLAHFEADGSAVPTLL